MCKDEFKDIKLDICNFDSVFFNEEISKIDKPYAASTICVAIDKGLFEPIIDNLPDIYIKTPQHKHYQNNNINRSSFTKIVAFLKNLHFFK